MRQFYESKRKEINLGQNTFLRVRGEVLIKQLQLLWDSQEWTRSSMTVVLNNLLDMFKSQGYELEYNFKIANIIMNFISLVIKLGFSEESKIEMIQVLEYPLSVYESYPISLQNGFNVFLCLDCYREPNSYKESSFELEYMERQLINSLNETLYKRLRDLALKLKKAIIQEQSFYPQIEWSFVNQVIEMFELKKLKDIEKLGNEGDI